MSTLFVTATDTGAGKTYVSCALLRAARAQGVRACGFKPVASGSERTADGLRNEDALALRDAAGTLDEEYSAINPYAFEPAIAPHLAARQAGASVELAKLDAAHAQLAARHHWIVVEGAGGWQVPLNERESFADWASARQWPVLLVVGMRLGCINHALLSADSIARRAPLLGWVANALPPGMPYFAENIATLDRLMPAPRLDVAGVLKKLAVVPA